MSTKGPSRYLEVERKFDVDESTQPPSFDGIAEVVRVEHAETQALDAVYFDTPARDLALNRITLRRRTGGQDAGWHLKLPAGPDARTEVRAPLETTDGSHSAGRIVGCGAGHRPGSSGEPRWRESAPPGRSVCSTASTTQCSPNSATITSPRGGAPRRLPPSSGGVNGSSNSSAPMQTPNCWTRYATGCSTPARARPVTAPSWPGCWTRRRRACRPNRCTERWPNRSASCWCGTALCGPRPTTPCIRCG